MKLRCLIVDDEPLAHKVLENYMAQTDFLEPVGNCYTGLEAISFLSRNSADIIFLDISMPRMTGTAFLQTVINRPAIIMTTAFRDYAVESYDFDVTDFLLKPFSFERFLKAVLRVQREKNHVIQPAQALILPEKPCFLKNGAEIIKLEKDAIFYVEGLKEYLKLHTATGTIIFKGNFRQIESAFPADTFLRIHKSFLAGVKHISNIRGNEMRVKDKWLPVGRSYKMQVQYFLENRLLPQTVSNP